MTPSGRLTLNEASRCGAEIPRGPPYASFAQTEIARLEEMRLAALEDRSRPISSAVATPPSETSSDLSPPSPFASVRAAADARPLPLGSSSGGSRGLSRCTPHPVEELGIEPGRELKELQEAILEQDPALDSSARSQSGGARRRSRRGRAPVRRRNRSSGVSVS